MKRILKKRPKEFQEIKNNPYLVVFHKSEMECGTFNNFSLLDKKIFFMIAVEIKSFIFELINRFEEQSICIGPYTSESNYCSWKNINDYMIVKELKKEIKAHEFITIVPDNNIALIEKIIESNLRYLTEISFFLPKSKMMLIVSHHSGFGIYSKKTNALYEILANLINTKYNNWNCVLKDYYSGEVVKTVKQELSYDNSLTDS